MPDLLDMVKELEEEKLKDLFEIEPIEPEKKDTQSKPISEPKEILSAQDIKESSIISNSNFVGIEELTKTSINAPIRVMMSIVTQLRMFDKNSSGLTPKGRNKKEIKAEIIALVFLGIITLVIVFLLAPDRSEQTLDTLTFLAVVLIMLPLLLISLQYFMKERARFNR